jgi:hypothetical protein
MSWRDDLDPDARDREITDELEAHLRMAIQDRIDRGESPEAARQAAEREFGNVGLVAAATRAVWSRSARQGFPYGSRGSSVRTAVRSLMAVVIGALFLAGSSAIYPAAYGLVAGTVATVDAERMTVLVLGVSSVTMLALVAMCANLTNQAIDRRRDSVSGRPRNRIRIPLA